MKVLISLFVCVFLLGTSFAEQELKVDEMQFCMAVEARQPVGVDSAFSNTFERIYCFTKITGAASEQKIMHVWYHENEERARIPLAVKSSPWRTWSSKKMIPQWHGNWRVDILDENGHVLNSATFTLAKDTE